MAVIIIIIIIVVVVIVVIMRMPSFLNATIILTFSIF